MNPNGGGVAILPTNGSRKPRPGPALKAGFLNKQNGKVRHDVTAMSNSAGQNSTGAAEVAKPVHGKGGKSPANESSSANANEEETEEPPPIAPRFEAATSPDLIAVDTTSMQLQWRSVHQLPLDMPPGPSRDDSCNESELPPCKMEYCLEMRVELGGSGAKSLGPSPWRSYYRGKDTVTQVRNLRPGRKYAFRIVLHPIVEPPYSQPPAQPPSSIVVFETPATVPGPPPPPTTTRTERTAIQVKWREPEESGGREIVEYHLQMSPAPGAEADAQREFVEIYKGNPKDMKYRVAKLQPAFEYVFRVKAFNTIGESEWSREAAFRTKATVPDQPQAPALVSAGPTAVTLHWPVPSSNGAPIEQYRLERDNGDKGDFDMVYQGPLPLVEVSGLRSGLTYRFRVQATNDAGKSMPSPVALIKTVSTTARAPGVPKVIGNNCTSASLSWMPPEDDGGSPVLGYEAELQPKSHAAIEGGMEQEWMLVYQGEAAACSVGGLRAGCLYWVRVRARNAAGFSPHSQPADVRTAAAVPEPPAAPRAVLRSAEALSVAWDPPAYNGGSTIASYRLELCRVGPTEGWDSGANKGKGKLEEVYATVPLEDGGLSCQAEIDCLDPGNEYLLRVYATNAQGSSPPSAVGKLCTRAAPPLAPDPPQLAGAAAADALRLTWYEPWPNGAPVTGYTLDVARADAMPSQPQGPPTPPQVGARDQDSVSAGSGGRPEVGYAVSSAASSVDGEDGASTSDAQRPAKRRSRCRCDPFGVFRTVYTGPEPSSRVEGLDPFTEYVFRLRASNVAGRSNWSSLVNLRTAPGPPSVPLSLTADGSSSSSLVASWDEPENHCGAPIISYHMDCSPVATRQRSQLSWQRAWIGNATSCEVEGLRPGREYMVRVRAVNSRGQGPWSAIAAAETLPAPPAAPPPPAVGQRTASSLRCRWEPPAEDNGAAVVHYRLELAEEDGEWSEAWRGTSTAARVDDLAAGRQYSFRVAASNAVGLGAFSRPTAARTLLQPPPAPRNISVQPTQQPLMGLLVRWELPEPSTTHAEAASHEVDACEEPASGSSSRQTVPGRVRECTFANLHPGTLYQVRARSVGVDGAGHSAWSEPVSLVTPGERTQQPAAASAVSADAAAAEAAVKKRRAKKPAVERELALADPKLKAQEKKAAMGQKQVKQLRAKPPLINLSKKHRRLLKHVLVCVVAFAVMLIFVMAAQHESSISKQAYKLAVKTHQEQQKAARAEARAEAKQRVTSKEKSEKQNSENLRQWHEAMQARRAAAQGGPGRFEDPFENLPPHISINDFNFDD